MDNSEVMELIDMLYTMVAEAWGVPLGNDKCIVEREKVLGIIEEIKARVPAEISEAKRLVSARDEFIANAKREAESIRRLAEEKARTMVEEQEVVRVSRARSNELLMNADTKSRELRRVANEYADDTLRRTEEAILAALGEVRQSRASFRNATGTPQSSGQQFDSFKEEDFT